MKEKTLFYSVARITILFFFIVSILSCSMEVSGPQPISEEETGMLVISSKPEGVQIFLNGFNTGRITPDSIASLQIGSYKVLLKTARWLDTTFTVQLESQKKERIFCDYTITQRMYGTIECNSTPSGADIIINDSLTGKVTPCTFQFLNPGKYKLVYQKTKCRDKVEEITLKMGDIYKASGILEDTSEWVTYNASNSLLTATRINSLCPVGKELWIGTHGEGLVKYYGGKKFTYYSKSNSPLPDNYVKYVAKDYLNWLWILSDYHLTLYFNDNWKVFPREEIDPLINKMTGIAFNKDDNSVYLLASTIDGNYSSIYKFIENQWIVLVRKLVSAQTIEINSSDNNNIWISSNGLLIYKESELYKDYSYGSPDYSKLGQRNIIKLGLANDMIYLVSNNLGSITNGSGGIFYYQGGKFTSVPISGSRFSSFSISTNGTIWFSIGDKSSAAFSAGLIGKYFDGIARYYGSTQFVPIENSLDITNFNGDVFIATYKGGLIKFKAGKN